MMTLLLTTNSEEQSSALYQILISFGVYQSVAFTFHLGSGERNNLLSSL